MTRPKLQSPNLKSHPSVKSALFVKSTVQNLQNWFVKNQRVLPWRQYKDPYSIWISETMLQQTTSVGVLPYYEKFLRKFPHLESLAYGSLEDVLELWAGLGYYSRARNLHQCAQQLLENKSFPKSWAELIKYPGIGPYTSRAISSLAFEEPVGVLDGNVIRVLSRYFDLELEWWKPQNRNLLQSIMDGAVEFGTPSLINQAFMELGATVCRPQSPHCQLCPLAKECLSRKHNTIASRPFKKAKKEGEIWLLNMNILTQKGKVLLTQEHELPFLKKQWMFPVAAKKIQHAPKDYHFKHSITHHDIFVKIQSTSKIIKSGQWYQPAELKKINPSSLIQKAWKQFVERGLET